MGSWPTAYLMFGFKINMNEYSESEQIENQFFEAVKHISGISYDDARLDRFIENYRFSLQQPDFEDDTSFYIVITDHYYEGFKNEPLGCDLGIEHEVVFDLINFVRTYDFKIENESPQWFLTSTYN